MTADRTTTDNDNDSPSLPPSSKSFICKQLSFLWNWAVNSIADFIAAVLSHPKIQDKVNALLLVAVTTLLDNPELADRLDAAAQRFTTDLSRHASSARQIGKDAPALVSGFMGGLISNVGNRRTLKEKGGIEKYTEQTTKTTAPTATTGRISTVGCNDGLIEQLSFNDDRKKDV